VNEQFINNEWIPALLSGEYEQGRAYLKRGGKFCCLGVAADLLQDEFSVKWMVANTRIVPNCDIIESIDGVMQTLSEPFRNFIGLSTSQAQLLASENDGGNTFAEIVPVIKSMLREGW